jgi:hypothetical protein
MRPSFSHFSFIALNHSSHYSFITYSPQNQTDPASGRLSADTMKRGYIGAWGYMTGLSSLIMS